MDAKKFDPPLDHGIAHAVHVLYEAAIETFESCEGGPGHAYPEPTVRFHGDFAEGFEALAVALRAGLPVSAIRRTWPINNGEPTGPWWEMTFYECWPKQEQQDAAAKVPASEVAKSH